MDDGAVGAGGAPLLELRGLTTVFPTRRGLVRAVDGLSFELGEGEKLGIVGESGSGKSVTLLSILRLVPDPGRIVAGDVRFRGQSLLDRPAREMRAVRGREIAMIFQDPMTTLNPVFRVGEQVRESLRIHNIVSPTRGVGGSSTTETRRTQSVLVGEAVNGLGERIERIRTQISGQGRIGGRRAAEQQRVWQALADVGIPAVRQSARRYPHQFSGGMQQRVLVAIALACEPQVLLADEPTTALDVTIQAQILDLLNRINQEHGTAIVLVTHNLAVVAEFCETIIVMYAGQLMEKGPIDQVIEEPMHPYTRGLLRCLPRMGACQERVDPIPGLVPDLADLAPGCPFAPRCDVATPECSQVEAVPVREMQDGRLVRCLLY